LAILSDLIAVQAVDGVDLSYVILKAAVILKHLGPSKHKQCLEYLEYLLDDPPVSEGMGKTHVLAVQLLVFEQGGEKYRVLLPKYYKELSASYQQDLQADGEHRVERLSSISEEEVWQGLSLQALDRCEYLLALEFAAQGVLKTPGKARLLHTLAEVLLV
jgi:hypothetical protein